MFQNIQSICNKIHLLEEIIEEKPDLHIICISESWLNNQKRDLLKIINFTICSSFCREQHEGGGVCILIRNTLDYCERLDISSMSIEMIFEICAIEIPKINLLIINLYWPNSKREIEVFYSRLERLLNHVSKKYKSKNVVIGGDFNVNVLANNIDKNRLFNLMISYNFHQKIKEPTRITQNSSTCIDLIFINFKIKDREIIVHNFGLSDHCGLLLSIPSNTQNLKNIVLYKRVYNDLNINKFTNELSNINWKDVLKYNNNVNENYNQFSEVLQKTLDKCIPRTLIKIKTRRKKHYLTLGIRTSCRHKRFLKLLVSRTKSKNVKSYYKQYCKVLKKTVDISRRNCNKHKFETSQNKNKSMWQIINNETNKNTKLYKNLKLITTDKCTLNNPKLIANTLNTFFASIGNSRPNCDNLTNTFSTKTIQNTFFLNPVDSEEINKIIRNLKNKTSFGIDEIPPILIKKNADFLTEPYTTLVNQSFSEGIFPDALKISVIKPVHKKGETTDMNNYRPIALLPTSAKIFESAMIKRLYSFYEKFKILHENQNGFRKNHSTTLAIYKYLKNILNEINDKKIAVGLLLDMSKAYDRVSYTTLLHKLYDSGIRGIAHSWLKSYLNNRFQYVEIENIDFETGKITRTRSDRVLATGSIPQGSVLASILFLIYINDLPNILDDMCVLFADDISILIPCSNTRELEMKLNLTLNKIIDWLEVHNLQLNLNKTKIIQFKPYQKTALDISYIYNNTKIEMVTSARLLGIELDTHLSWKQQIQKIIRKLSSFIYALQHLKRVTDFKTALAAYYAYAHSILSYGVILWGNSSEINKVFILQKKCIRIITNIDQMDSCRPHFVKHKILTLTSIYILESCKFVREHPDFYSPLTNNKRNNRNLNKLSLPFSKMKLITSNSHIMTIKIYNHIPNHIKNLERHIQFTKQLKTFLINKCYYDLNEFFDDKGNS